LSSDSNPEKFTHSYRAADTNALLSETPQLTVVVPAYNEEQRLGATLKRMLAYFDAQPYSVEILIVDDGSSDHTAQIVEQIAQRRPNVRLLSYGQNRGKGHAVRHGILQARGTRVLFSDADLATPIEELEKLTPQLDSGSDIAIGSRDMVGSQLIKRQSWIREMGGRTFNKMVQLLAVPGIRDTQCGFKLFTQSAARRIFSQCQVDHFAFDVEVLYLARRCGLRIAEVPVRWAHQEGSKVRFFRDAWRMVKTLVRIRLTHYDPAATPAKIQTP
jgi:dolichyl-phosphate beta-glucosyltransferase